MVWIILGLLSFVIYILYDLNQVRGNCPIFRSLFLIATILLLCSTGALIVLTHGQLSLPLPGRLLALALAALCLGLLVYALFFALPFHDTYVDSGGKRPVYDRGMYALCRHPGVLWFILFYAFLWLAAGSLTLLGAGIAFSLGNVVYVILQDYLFFPRLFDGYDEYRCTAPFLWPRTASIKRCLATRKRR